MTDSEIDIILKTIIGMVKRSKLWNDVYITVERESRGTIYYISYKSNCIALTVDNESASVLVQVNYLESGDRFELCSPDCFKNTADYVLENLLAYLNKDGLVDDWRVTHAS